MEVKSVCPYCGVGCGIKLIVENNKVVKVLGREDHPVSKGKLCIKGLTLDKVIHHPERLKYPLIKKGDELVKASWSEAISLISEKFKEIKETYGSDAIGIFASKRCTNEDNYLIQKFARVVIGTNNVDNAARLCHIPTVRGLYQVLGRSAMTNSYEDFSESKCILIFGDNVANTQPIAFPWILKAKERGGKLIVVDVRETETAKRADIFVQINPNTDILFIIGICKVILREGLENKEFIKNRTLGFKEFKESLEKFKMDYIEKITGINEKLIEKVAMEYAKAESASIIYGMGITQQSNSLESVLAIADLALLTGNFGRPGTGVNPLRGCNNVQGCCDMGCLPEFYPGYHPLTEETIHKFKNIWNVDNLPITLGLTQVEMVESIPEKILGMYIIGEDPLVSFPDVNRIERDLKNLEFLVVQDIFLTETAKIAHVVLPAACFAEKTGTFTNSERRVQLIKKAVEAPGKAMEDWKIIKAIAEKMGYGKYFNYNSSEEIFEEIRKAVPTYSGITYEKLERLNGIQWPCDDKHVEGKKILYDKDFGPARNRAVFYPLTFTPKEINPSYPFILTTFRLLEHYDVGSMTRKIDILNKIQPESFVLVTNEDADELKIKEGDYVKVSSPLGEIIVKARIGNLKKGVIAVPNHFAEARVNKLIWRRLDPVSKIPSFKYCYARIEKV
ncbi:MAG: formate dehydrogenase subunit alpha [Candidatus Aenigmatarchaeota archaeon]